MAAKYAQLSKKRKIDDGPDENDGGASINAERVLKRRKSLPLNVADTEHKLIPLRPLSNHSQTSLKAFFQPAKVFEIFG